jgi:hypothetical protein
MIMRIKEPIDLSPTLPYSKAAQLKGKGGDCKKIQTGTTTILNAFLPGSFELLMNIGCC